MIVEYTKNQLLVDSDPLFKLTERKIRTVLSYLLKENMIVELRKGSKGKATVYEITTMKQLLINRQLSDNDMTVIRQLSDNNDIVIPTVVEDERQPSDNNVTTKRQQSVQPIKDKDNEKDKKDNIYSQEREIFDYWNSKKGTITSLEKSFDKAKITTILKRYKKDAVLESIDRMNKAILDINYFYDNKWNIYNFIKQANGISQWQDDGQYWINYLKDEGKVGQAKPKKREVKDFE